MSANEESSFWLKWLFMLLLLAVMLLFVTYGHSQTIKEPVRFLSSGEVACCLSENQFATAYRYFREESGQVNPKVVVIHASDYFKEWVEPGDASISHVERSDKVPSGEVKYYVVWVFGSGDNVIYTKALEAIFKDACQWDDTKAHEVGQKVFNRLNQNFVDAKGKR